MFYFQYYFIGKNMYDSVKINLVRMYWNTKWKEIISILKKVKNKGRKLDSKSYINIGSFNLTNI